MPAARHFARLVFGDPWMILPEKLEQIARLAELRASGGRMTDAQIRAAIGGTRSAAARIGPASGIAIVNVHGTIAPRATSMERSSGVVSAERFSARMRQLAEQPPEAVVISFDTPGGSVLGIAEAADAIRELAKKTAVWGIANPMAASAGYYLLAQCSGVVVAPGGMVGSIGTIAAHEDDTQARSKRGYVRTLVTAGRYKAEGYGPLTEEARAEMQRKVDHYYHQFVAAVAAGRHVSPAHVAEHYGQGRMLVAEEALRLGMVDRIATLATLVAELIPGASIDGLLLEDAARGAVDALGRAPAIPATHSPYTAADPLYRPVVEPSRDVLIVSTHSPAPAASFPPGVFAMTFHEALIRLGACGLAATPAEQMAAARAYLVAAGVDFPSDEAGVQAALVALATTRTAPLRAVEATPAQLAQPVREAAPAALVPAGVQAGAAPDDDRAANILAACRLAGLDDPAASAAALIADRSLTLAAALGRVQEMQAARAEPVGRTRVEVTRDERDTLAAFGRDCMLQRHFGGAAIEGHAYTEGSDRVYTLRSMTGLARRCLQVDGMSQRALDRLPDHDVAAIAMGGRPPIGAFSDGAAYNASGLFPNILLDAANITARNSYRLAQTTFQRWARRAESIADFKAVHRVVLGELPYPKAIPENGEFEETTSSDARENYKLTVWGQMFSLTWQMIVNDQLGEFMRIPQKQGTAMRHRQNQLVYGILGDNAALADGTALFATSGHANLAASGGAVSVSTLNTAVKAMMTQTALSGASGTVLNIAPRFLLHPVAIRGVVLQLLKSYADPAAGGSAAGNSNTANIYQGAFEPIEDAQLDAQSATAWYMAADPSVIDTVEYAYLQGMEDAPRLEEAEAFDRLVRKYRIYQAFGTKAIDYRGLYKNPGA